MITSLTSSSLPLSLSHVMFTPMFIKVSSEIFKGAHCPIASPKRNGLGRTDGLELGAALGAVDGEALGPWLGEALGSREGLVDGTPLGWELGLAEGLLLGELEGTDEGLLLWG